VSDHAAHQRHRRGTSSRRARLLAIACFLIAAVGGYALGLNIAYRDLAAARQLVTQLQVEGQKFRKQLNDQGVGYTALQAKLAALQSAMDEMKPAQNTYDIKPNQSLVVGGGHLTIGLVGSPTNDSVNLNINGKKQAAATGDVITVAADPATSCQVEVQSFDMFKAQITATCAPAKP
jgi:hypothetical protein